METVIYGCTPIRILANCLVINYAMQLYKKSMKIAKIGVAIEKLHIWASYVFLKEYFIKNRKIIVPS